MAAETQKFRVAMCCDFFYPRHGGVEMHIWSLSQCLLQRGHKVIVITHAVPPPSSNANAQDPKAASDPIARQLPGWRSGVRVMTNRLKVYYLPLVSMVDSVSYPSFVTNFALFRAICIRENIQIVHGHQATSTLMHECLIHAKTMGFLKTIYTDHSLFGFADAASVHLNKVMKFSLATIDHAICVSHTCRENLVLRASLSPSIVSTIPNAVDVSKFTPLSREEEDEIKARARAKAQAKAKAKAKAQAQAQAQAKGQELEEDQNDQPDDRDRINVVIVSRLVYRKGIDLVAQTIPLVCARNENIHFIIGGDGPKRLLLEEMRERHHLHDRVHLHGAVAHSDVRNVLCQGHIYLNSSLTESFCIAILEAAACGLFIVSTRVGGVPEVLPSDMIKFAEEMSPYALANAIMDAIPLAAKADRHKFHDRVEKMYNWHDVAQRTERVYGKVVALPSTPLLHRFQQYFSIGPIAGSLACMLFSLLYLYLCLLEHWKPADEIERALDLRLRPAPVQQESQEHQQNKSGRSTSRTGRSSQRYDQDARLVVCILPTKEINGEDHVLLISSSKNPSEWILPKGGWEQDEQLHECALREAEEEAGVTGRVVKQLGQLRFVSQKRNSNCLHGVVLQVEREFEAWPEQATRLRKWTSLDDARRLLNKRPELIEFMARAFPPHATSS